jgi:hypothetical protein
MQGRGTGGVVLAAFAGLIGCGDARPLDPIALSADGRFLVGHATCAAAPASLRAALP